MIAELASRVGYTKAPKAMFVLKHPVKGAAAMLAARSMSRGTSLMLGATAVAVPLGIWYLRHR
ncbi:MAG: hypothetical protein ACRELD_16540 [Longimicrobiales bacterium]